MNLLESKEVGQYLSESSFEQTSKAILEHSKKVLEIFDLKYEPVFLFGSLVTFCVYSALGKNTPSIEEFQIGDIDIGIDILDPLCFFEYVDSVFRRFEKKFGDAKKMRKSDGVICISSPNSPFSLDLVWIYCNARMEHGIATREKFVLQTDFSCNQWYFDHKSVFGSNAAFATLRTGIVTVHSPVVRPSRLEKVKKRGLTINFQNKFKIGIEETDLPENYQWEKHKHTNPPFFYTIGSYHILPAFHEHQIESWSDADFDPFFEKSDYEGVFKNPLRLRVQTRTHENKEGFLREFDKLFPRLRTYLKDRQMDILTMTTSFSGKEMIRLWSDFYIHYKWQNYRFVCFDVLFASFKETFTGAIEMHIRILNVHGTL